MSVFDSLLAIIAPHNCLNCGREPYLICVHCRHLLKPPLQSCYLCLHFTSGGQICTRCKVHTPLDSVYAVSRYEGVSKQLVWSLKYSGTQSAAKLIASELTRVLPYKNRESWVIVPVPTASRRARQRGYDQANLIARELSRLTGLPCRKLLTRHGQTHQVGASRGQRKSQLRGVFRVKATVKLPTKVILVDDVLTTGSTLREAAKVLRHRGVEHIEAAVFARA